jgi:hypothetical protein
MEVVDTYGGIAKGLPELFGYLSIVNEFKHTTSQEKTQTIMFDSENSKYIQIPEIILTQ